MRKKQSIWTHDAETAGWSICTPREKCCIHTEQRKLKKKTRSLSHPSRVNTLIAVGKGNKWVTSHLERFSLQSFVQNHKACVLSLSQLAGLVLRSKLGPRRQAAAYSVGVVATGVRMGVSDSLKGHIGEMALWL